MRYVRNKKIVLTISIIVVLVIAGVLVLFLAGHRTQITQTDLKQIDSNKEGEKADKKIEKKEEKKAEPVEKVTLSNIDEELQGVYFYDTEWITSYSQVEDGHYYWLRYDGCYNEYVIYRDDKKEVGTFKINDDYYSLEGFVKYENNFYAIIGYSDSGLQKLMRVNLDTKRLETLYDISETPVSGDGKFRFCCIYQDYFYFDKQTKWQSSYLRSKSLKLPIEGGIAKGTPTTELPTTTNRKKAKPYLLYMDNKIFYVLEEDSKIKLFCYDMPSESEQKFFEFRDKQKSSEESSFLEIDRDYIYYGNDMISRKTGKVFSPFHNMKKSKGSRKNYTANDKYVFYLDKQNRVHRLDKKTKQDIIIRKEKTLAVSCVGNRLYIRVRDEKGYNQCRKDEYDNDEGVIYFTTYYADNLYCMDFDGKQLKKIWNGGYDEDSLWGWGTD